MLFMFLFSLEFKAQTEAPILEDGGDIVHCTCGEGVNSSYCDANGDGASTCKILVQNAGGIMLIVCNVNIN